VDQEGIDVTTGFCAVLHRRDRRVVRVRSIDQGLIDGGVHGSGGRLPDQDGIAVLAEVSPVDVPQDAALGVWRADGKQQGAGHRRQRRSERVDDRGTGPTRCPHPVDRPCRSLMSLSRSRTAAQSRSRARRSRGRASGGNRSTAPGSCSHSSHASRRARSSARLFETAARHRPEQQRCACRGLSMARPQPAHRSTPSAVCTKSRPGVAPSPGAGSERVPRRSPERSRVTPFPRCDAAFPHMATRCLRSPGGA
jgi:hypothetical protein